jgi:hypothetical protein
MHISDMVAEGSPSAIGGYTILRHSMIGQWLTATVITLRSTALITKRVIPLIIADGQRLRSKTIIEDQEQKAIFIHSMKKK